MKIRLNKNAAFVLFLIFGSAMDSDTRVLIVIMVLAMLWLLYHMGQAYRKENYEEQSIVAHNSHGDGGTGCL